MFRAKVLIVRRAKLYITVSGIITPIGGCPVHGTATYMCDDTRDCNIQFCPPDDEHMCSKHVEAWNKLIIKFSASGWLILRNKSYFTIRQARSLFIILTGKIWLTSKRKTYKKQEEVYCVRMKVKLPSTPWCGSLRHCVTNRKVAGSVTVSV